MVSVVESIEQSVQAGFIGNCVRVISTIAPLGGKLAICQPSIRLFMCAFGK